MMQVMKLTNGRDPAERHLEKTPCAKRRKRPAATVALPPSTSVPATSKKLS
jgi:hypothetical protein